MIKDTLTQDLKTALLNRDADRTMILRGLKGVILDAEIAAGVRGSGLKDDAIIALFQKEAKKRQESADLYKNAGELERAEKELFEKSVIETYLPKQMTEEEISGLVSVAIVEANASDVKDMGRVIGLVKEKTKGAADGAVIARLVKEQLHS